ncbi:gamma-aminobutyric acid receptor subunit beta-like isoform X1 [Varroa jacobsoni]|uniref:gamma-aminobutyric acid receptor subunit beta-like isoform X1 n=1 Tax=Varroa jacobsoni TaxID=62625 RepID=UPI000BF6F5FB|nr:gamma-aminobutyric acid receptor subunit beta-like isoform X1 [Varroa jacobsoni]XP_022688194.1 gamma-aminobutyric acid receptor subunit beta-like isoform X1 [Varroa jacobsoni]XP_022688195.1 gamma-aminobutyric acid receptor subunit beta-like isoform X1 [Varroa jacobsoni]
MRQILLSVLLIAIERCYGLLELQDKLFINLTDAAVYNKRTRPSYIIGIPLLVRLNVVIHRMDGIDDVHTEYEADVEFTLRWRDDRLEYDSQLLLNFPIQGDHWHANQIWLPNLHVANDKQYTSIIDLSPGSVHVLIRSNGEVVLSKRAHLKLRCEMELYKYPLDKQTCGMTIESSSLPISHLRMQWSKRPGLLLADPSHARGFTIQNYSTYEAINHRLVGNFSLVTSEFVLSRQFGPFLLDIYIPGVAFVFTSWLSFWMEVTAAPARISLSITTMLTMVTSGKTIREKLPKVPYVHALDIWLLACTAFIFFVLFEYAIVNYIYNRDKRVRQGGLRRVDSCVSLASSVYHNSSENGKPLGEPISKKRAKQMGLEPLNTSQVGGSASINGALRPPHSPARGASSGSIFQFPPDLDPIQVPPSPSLSVQYSRERVQSIVRMPLTNRDIANCIDRRCRLVFPLGFAIFNAVYWTILCR